MINSFKKYFLLFIILVLFIASLLPFLGNLNDPFVSDDWDFLRVAVERGGAIGSYFFTNTEGNFVGGSYRPMVNIFWGVSYHFFGFNPFGYHLITLLFHSANVILLFLLLYYLPWFRNKPTGLIIALMASVFFIVLPNHAEGVVWIAVINDTMMTFFYLLSLFFLLLASKMGKTRLFFYIGSLIFFLLSLLTKEMALTLPGVIFLVLAYDCYQQKINSTKIVKSLLVFLPYAIILGLFLWWRQQLIGLLLGDYVHKNFVITGEIAWRAYISIFFSNFLSDGARAAVTDFFIDHRPVLSWLVFVSALIGILISLKKRVGGLGWLIAGAFLISIVPVIRFGVNATPIYFSEEGERYAYLPSVFWVILVALIFGLFYTFLIKKSLYFKPVLIILFISLTVLSAGQLIQKNKRWHAAAIMADSLIANAAEIIVNQHYDGVVFVGMPDDYHGAFIFRNAFQLALARRLGKGLNFPNNMIITSNRAFFEPKERFTAERISDKVFQYSSVSGKPLIVAEPKVDTLDYQSELINRQRELMSISYRDYGSGLKFELTEDFLKHNQEAKKRIGILFFSGESWIPFDF